MPSSAVGCARRSSYVRAGSAFRTERGLTVKRTLRRCARAAAQMRRFRGPWRGIRLAVAGGWRKSNAKSSPRCVRPGRLVRIRPPGDRPGSDPTPQRRDLVELHDRPERDLDEPGFRPGSGRRHQRHRHDHARRRERPRLLPVRADGAGRRLGPVLRVAVRRSRNVQYRPSFPPELRSSSTTPRSSRLSTSRCRRRSSRPASTSFPFRRALSSPATGASGSATSTRRPARPSSSATTSHRPRGAPGANLA